MRTYYPAVGHTPRTRTLHVQRVLLQLRICSREDDRFEKSLRNQHKKIQAENLRDELSDEVVGLDWNISSLNQYGCLLKIMVIATRNGMYFKELFSCLS